MEQTEKELEDTQKQDWNSLSLLRDEDKCKGKELITWRSEIRGILNRIKSSKVAEIKAMVKISDINSKVLEAFMIVLGYKTKITRKQAMKDYKDSKIDFLKQAKTAKPPELTFEDCKEIQNLLNDINQDKVENIEDPFKDFLKWTNNMIEMRIALARFTEVSVKSKSKTIKPSNEDEHGIPSEDITQEEFKIDSQVEDWGSFTPLDEHKSEPYDLKILYETEKKGVNLYKKEEFLDYKIRVPPKYVINLYALILSLYGINTDTKWDARTSYKEYTIMINEKFCSTIAYSLTYFQMKKIQNYLNNYSDEAMKSQSPKVKMYFLRLKAAYECCLYRKLYGRVTRLNKYSEWERLIFRKTEEESTGENLKKWTEETYQLVKNYTGGEILRGLMVFNYHWDHVNFLDPEVGIIIDCLYILISKISEEDAKLFKEFNGFDNYGCGDDTPLADTFQNKLDQLKIEDLTMGDCLSIQQKFDTFYLFDQKHGKTAKDMFDFIDNIVQLRIALGLYGGKS